MTSKSSGKAPPSVGSVTTCPPVRVDRSSSVPAQPSTYFEALCIPPSAQSYSHAWRLVPGTPQGWPDARVAEPHYNTGGSRRNDLREVTFYLQIARKRRTDDRTRAAFVLPLRERMVTFRAVCDCCKVLQDVGFPVQLLPSYLRHHAGLPR